MLEQPFPADILTLASSAEADPADPYNVAAWKQVRAAYNTAGYVDYIHCFFGLQNRDRTIHRATSMSAALPCCRRADSLAYQTRSPFERSSWGTPCTHSDAMHFFGLNCATVRSILVFADESVRTAADVHALAELGIVDGVNIKLEKAGG